jgi:2-polyprenyl-6-hydroxyphenyl methylase/3-demethylubiquinone-9 3-methyltransferase
MSQNAISSTVDPEEVKYYERLAETWWDTTGPFWPLHRLNTFRVRFIRDTIRKQFNIPVGKQRPLAGLRVLDVGCGGGILSEAVAALGAEVNGIDVVERNIRIAQWHGQQDSLSVSYQVTSVEALVAAGSRYDVVLNMEVVEHVANLPIFLPACCSLVRPGGLMFIATINRTVSSWLFAIIGAEYILRWLPRGTHRWRKFPRPEEVQGLLEASGLQVLQRRGVRINPLTRHFSHTSSLAVNYMIVAKC